MRRTLAIVGLLLLLAGCVGAQNFSGASSGDIFVLPPHRACFGADDSGSACFSQSAAGILRLNGKLDFVLVTKTVATLPSATLNAGRVYRVTDGTSASDCTTGASTTSVVCVSNGTVWAALGGGGGGSSAGSATAGQASDGSGGFVDDGCTVTGGVHTCGAFVTTGPGGGVGQYSNEAEGTAPATDAAGNTFGGTGFDGGYADATSHCRKLKQNGVAGGCIAAPLGTLAIASGKTATISNTITLTGTDSASYPLNAFPLTDLAPQAADTVILNATGGSAVPSAVAIPSCAADGSHALTYPSHVPTCTAISGGGSVPPTWVPFAGAYTPSTGTANVIVGGIAFLTSSPPVFGGGSITGYADTAISFAHSATNTMFYTTIVPSGFTGTLNVDLATVSIGANGNVRWSMAVACAADGGSLDNPTYNTAVNVTKTVGAVNVWNNVAFASITTTGCSAGKIIQVRLQRLGSDGADTDADANLALGMLLKWG